MLALRYAHRLPADYALERIRARAATRGPLWDATPGLAFKAFAVRTRGVAGASGNVYASIYLWLDAAAATDMLADPDRFGAVIAAFGRPSVDIGLPLAARTKGDGSDVRALVQDEVALDADVDPATLRASEAARVADALGDPDVLAAVSALDPTAWRLTRTVLLRTPVEAVRSGTAYDVAYLARPGWARLKQGES
jgi:Domain of unknown function (DUF4865)